MTTDEGREGPLSTRVEDGTGAAVSGRTDLDDFFDEHDELPVALKHNLIRLGVTSLDKLLKMKSSHILMYANLDKFDESLSTDLISLIAILEEHKQQHPQDPQPASSAPS